MKATLTFNLPEEETEHLNALRGTSYKIVLEEMDNYFRNILKYEERSEEVNKTLQQAREALHELIVEAER